MQFSGTKREPAPRRARKEVDVTQRPVVRNPKYAHVQATLYTGAKRGDAPKKFDTSGEIFRRVRTSTVHGLLSRREGDEESIYHLGSEDGRSVMTERTTASHAAEEKEMASVIADWDLLLLDVRDEEAHKRCSIVGSVSFPAIRLRRDQMIRELYEFRNRRGKVIVLCDDDGYSKLGIDMATEMVRKGFENTLLMTGGVAKFAHYFPDAVDGPGPAPPLPDRLRRIEEGRRDREERMRRSMATTAKARQQQEQQRRGRAEGEGERRPGTARSAASSRSARSSLSSSTATSTVTGVWK